mgnify:CR=1 FL=1
MNVFEKFEFYLYMIMILLLGIFLMISLFLGLIIFGGLKFKVYPIEIQAQNESGINLLN